MGNALSPRRTCKCIVLTGRATAGRVAEIQAPGNEKMAEMQQETMLLNYNIVTLPRALCP